MLALVSYIPDLSAIEAGKHVLRKEQLNMSDVIAECMQIIAARAEKKKQVLSVDMPDNVPLLYEDRRAVKQIFLNILSNAVKYTPENG